MWRLSRPSAFQLADSVLLGLAAAAIFTIIVHLVQGEAEFLEFRAYMILLGAGLVTAVIALIVGINRGHDKIDGVFMGPKIRISSILCVFIAVGMAGFLVGETQEALKCDDGTVVSSMDQCRPGQSTTERCASAIEHLAMKVDEARAIGTFGALEAGPRGRLLEAAKSVNGTCPIDERTAPIDNFRSYRDAGAEDEPEKTQDQMLVDDLVNAIQGPVENVRVVIDPEAPGNPSTTQVTVPDSSVPVSPSPDAGEPDGEGEDRPTPDPGDDEGDSDPDSPPENTKTVTREYRLGLLPELLNQILGGIGFGFGGVSITTTEIQSALENNDVVEGGQTLANEAAKLEAAPRARLYWELIQLVTLEESVGGEADVDTIASALQRDPAHAMCLFVVLKETEDEMLEFVSSLEGPILNNFTAVRHELGEDVTSCIDALIEDQDRRDSARQIFQSIMEVLDAG